MNRCFVFFLCLLSNPGFAQRPVQDAGRFSEQAGKYVKAHVRERCYVHFDRSTYAVGDTVYFKAYVTAGEKHLLSHLSGVLHVELIDGMRQIRRSLLFQLNGGVAWGDIALPDSLPGGLYQIRAYTRWMRNSGDSSIFSRSFALGLGLGKNGIQQGAEGKSAPAAPAVVFFPEGGSLVSGIASRIAFLATDSRGLGLAVKGTIVNAENEVVDSFATQHAGMGSFRLRPQKNESYRAKVTYKAGSQEVLLQRAIQDGITLSVTNDQLSKASVKIEASRSFYEAHKDKDFYLLVSSGDKLVTVTCKLDNQVITMNLVKASLSTGIVRVTLFAPDLEPLCERLFFVRNSDESKLDLTPDRASYTTRERVSIKLHVADRLDSGSRGHYSVSVTDESKFSVNENAEHTLLTELLLTSDLRGYVEEPNYYFATSSARIRSELDLVMLTHGYRQFAWKEVLQGTDKANEYLPETGLEIAGVASTLQGKPIAEGTVSLFTPRGGPMFTQRTDRNGVFRFANLNYPDSTRFVLNAANSKGKNQTKLRLKTHDIKIPQIISNDPALAEQVNIMKQDSQVIINTLPITAINHPAKNVIQLKEVKVRAKRDENYQTESLAGAGHADQVMHRAEVEQIGGMLATSLNGRLHGIVFLNAQGGEGGVPYWSGHPKPMVIVVDGNVLPVGTGVNSLGLAQIETVEVLKYASSSMYGLDGGNGVLVITTKRGRNEPSDTVSVGVLPLVATGFYKAREFYVPKYDHSLPPTNRPDNRKTIYWKPDVISDTKGNANFGYYNSDGKGSYRVLIEGISDKGALVRKVYHYKVE